MNPGVTEQVGQTARSAIDVMKSQPLLLALVILNMIVFAAVFYSLLQTRQIQERLTITDQKMIAQAMEYLSKCVNPEALRDLNLGK